MKRACLAQGTQSMSPFRLARCNAVTPAESEWLGSTLASSKMRAIAMWPSRTAQCNPVLPCRSVVLGFWGFESMDSTRLSRLPAQADRKKASMCSLASLKSSSTSCKWLGGCKILSSINSLSHKSRCLKRLKPISFCKQLFTARTVSPCAAAVASGSELGSKIATVSPDSAAMQIMALEGRWASLSSIL